MGRSISSGVQGSSCRSCNTKISVLVEGVGIMRRRKRESILKRAGWLWRLLLPCGRRGWGWILGPSCAGASAGCARTRAWGTGQGWPGQEAALGAGLGSGGHLPAQGPPCMEEFRHREVNVTAELQKTEPLTRTQAGGYFFPQGLTIS